MNLARHQRALRRVQRVLEQLLDQTAGSISNGATNYRVALWDVRAAVRRAVAALEAQLMATYGIEARDGQYRVIINGQRVEQVFGSLNDALAACGAHRAEKIDRPAQEATDAEERGGES